LSACIGLSCPVPRSEAISEDASRVRSVLAPRLVSFRASAQSRRVLQRAFSAFVAVGADERRELGMRVKRQYEMPAVARRVMRACVLYAACLLNAARCVCAARRDIVSEELWRLPRPARQPLARSMVRAACASAAQRGCLGGMPRAKAGASAC